MQALISSFRPIATINLYGAQRETICNPGSAAS